MTWPALAFWVLILIGLFVPAEFMLYLFFVAGTFGGLSLLPPGAIGNVPITTVCAAVLIAKTFFGRRKFRVFLQYALDYRKLGLLTMFGLYMAVTAFLYPRLFAGSVKLYSLNAAGNISFLSPSSSNITQPIYMFTSIGMTFVFAYRGQNSTFRNNFLCASLVGATLLLGSGIIDTILGGAGLEDLLLPFHNATYALIDNAAIAGQRRVIGFMPEASTYGTACCTNLGFLVFNRQAYQGPLRDLGVPIVAIGLLIMIYLSTSSSAYVGLAALAFVLVIKSIFGMVSVKVFTAAHFQKLLLIIGGAVASLAAFTCLSHGFLMHVQLLLDGVLFEKNSSSSYFERNAWTSGRRCGLLDNARGWCRCRLYPDVELVCQFCSEYRIHGTFSLWNFCAKIVVAFQRLPGQGITAFCKWAEARFNTGVQCRGTCRDDARSWSNDYAYHGVNICFETKKKERRVLQRGGGDTNAWATG